MNSRELALVSTATVFGALASAFAVRFYSSNGNSRKQFSKINSVPDCDVSKKCSSQSPFDPSKRKEYLSWDDYFMAIALLSAERSKDPNRQVGACLVSQNGIILGKLILSEKLDSYNKKKDKKQRERRIDGAIEISFCYIRGSALLLRR
ncbi:hypothetical protein NC651_028928 [Populus alba x Populus x berolinensis]|nr:hypothetical protein NC651_028928 [Populus alba x Populus x berolinensis]